MAERIKQRLIGLAVVVTAAVVVLPLVLTGDGYRERQLQTQIPPEPAPFKTPDMTLKSQVLPDTRSYPDVKVAEAPSAPAAEIRPVEVAPAQAATPVEQPEVAVAKVPKPAPVTVSETEAAAAKTPVAPSVEELRPELDAQGVPVAWTLQLASFKDESNAKALRKQLIDAGHKVYTRRQADLYKVFVGPEAQRDRLEALKMRLQTDFGLDGIIIRFTTQ